MFLNRMFVYGKELSEMIEGDDDSKLPESSLGYWNRKKAGYEHVIEARSLHSKLLLPYILYNIESDSLYLCVFS